MREGKGSEGSLSVRVGTGLLGIPRVDLQLEEGLGLTLMEEVCHWDRL